MKSALLLLEEEIPGPSASSGEALQHVLDNVNCPITLSQWDAFKTSQDQFSAAYFVTCVCPQAISESDPMFTGRF